MSIFKVNTESFVRVFDKMCTYQFRKEESINYCSILSLCEGECRQIISTLCLLNDMSFCYKYKKPFTEKEKKRSDGLLKLNFNTSNCEKINSYQMLKSLECILSNIDMLEIPSEIQTWTMQFYAKLLEEGINEIKTMIISEIPEYQTAEWR